MYRRSSFHELFDVFHALDSQLPVRAGGYVPAVESFTKDGRIIIQVELPGVDAADVTVSLTGRELLISGEKKTTHEVAESDVHIREVSRGRFERGFTLPEGLRTEELKARFDKGVLEVSVPLPAEVQPRRIEIEAPPTQQIKAA